MTSTGGLRNDGLEQALTISAGEITVQLRANQTQAPAPSGEGLPDAPGKGRYITIYANPGHVYMTIDGRRYDTSARSETGSRWSGTQRSSSGYVVRHPPGY